MADASPPPIDRVKALLAALPREDQEDLTRFLHDILVTPEEAEALQTASLQEKQGGEKVTYTFRNEFIRCGKDGCWCGNGLRGEGHGPYTYKYWKEDGRLRKKYLGRAKGAVKRRGPSGRAGRARGSNAANSSDPAPPEGSDPRRPVRT